MTLIGNVCTQPRTLAFAMLVCVLFGLTGFKASAQTTDGPPSILAKVRDIQDFPTMKDFVASQAGNNIFSTFIAGYISDRLGRMNPKSLSQDAISFCTCPATFNPSAPNGGLPFPNGPGNVNTSKNFCDDYPADEENTIAVKVIGNVLKEVNKMISAISQKFYNGLIKNDQLLNIFNAAMVLYLTIYGIMIATGILAVGSGDIMNRLIKVAILWALLNPAGGAWDLFFNYFGRFFQEGVMQMMYVFADIAKNGQIVEAIRQPVAVYDPNGTALIYEGIEPTAALIGFLNEPMNLIFSIKFAIMMVSIPFVGAFGLVVFIILLVGILLFIYMLISAFYTFLKSLVGLYLMLGLAPIFLSFFLFKRTREMFNAWINQLITFFLQPILLFAFLGFFVVMFQQNLKNIIDKTEYCYVRFTPFVGVNWDFMWFRPAVVFDKVSFDTVETSAIDKAKNYITAKYKTDQEIFDAVQGDQISQTDAYRMLRIGVISDELARRIAFETSRIDVKRDSSGNIVCKKDASGNIIYTRKQDGTQGPCEPVRELTGIDGKMDKTVVENIIAAKASGSSNLSGSINSCDTEQVLYAYRGNWIFNGPAESEFIKATGRFPRKGDDGNDFPINPNDVLLFMLITFLAFRYSDLIGEIAGQLGGGISNVMTGEDARKWFNSNLGVAYAGKGINQNIDKAADMMSNVKDKIMNAGAKHKPPEIIRPPLVNPDDPKGVLTKPGANPDPNWNQQHNRPKTAAEIAQDAQVNKATYDNSVNSRVNNVLNEVNKLATITDPDKFVNKDAQQKKMEDMLKDPKLTKQKLQQMIRSQRAVLNNKANKFVRENDRMAHDKNISEHDREVFQHVQSYSMMNDSILIDAMNEKLKSMP